jgi:hypothetical protein
MKSKKCLEAYFRPRSWERKGGGEFYRRLGVAKFKKYLRPWSPILNEEPGSREEKLRAFDLETRKNEGVHVVGAIITATLVPIFFHINAEASAIFLLAIELPSNTYPIMVQRYNRARIFNLLERMEARQENATTSAA